MEIFIEQQPWLATCCFPFRQRKWGRPIDIIPCTLPVQDCNSGDKHFWSLFDFNLRSSTSKSTPSFSRRLFSSDKEGLEEEISDSRHFWKTRLRIFVIQSPGQHEEGEGVSKVRFVFGLHHRGNIRVRMLVRPDMSSDYVKVTFSMQTIIVSANCS